jgi:hypothetical protein
MAELGQSMGFLWRSRKTGLGPELRRAPPHWFPLAPSPMSRTKEPTMTLTKLSVLSAAALLAGGISIAAAQSSMGSSSGSAATQGKCWDSASNSIKDKAANRNETTSGAKAPGGVTTGASPTGAASESPGQSPNSRPAEARNLPNC